MIWKKIGVIDIMLPTILMAAVIAMSNAAKYPLCTEINKPCIRNTDCCDGCCFQEKCVSYAENCVKENNPCYLHECPPNTSCYLQKVQCIQAPCPPIPACKSLDYDYN